MMMFPWWRPSTKPGIDAHCARFPGKEMAAQTLSCYFSPALAWLVGGGDVIGRRPTILAGLDAHLLASIVALFSGSFSVLLAARVPPPLARRSVRSDANGDSRSLRRLRVGAAVLGDGDRHGDQPGGWRIARRSADSPLAIRGACGLALLAARCWGCAGWQLPETRPQQAVRHSFFGTLGADDRRRGYLAQCAAGGVVQYLHTSYYQLRLFHFAALERRRSGSVIPVWCWRPGPVSARRSTSFLDRANTGCSPRR
ncbi:hypothetical protein M8494_20275 [Serratia ureilytica]